jgi:putative cofactor-binding repeat protein
VIHSTGNHGILTFADYSVISGNVIDSSASLGISVAATSTETAVVGNMVRSCASGGITNLGDRTVITANIVRANTGAGQITDSGTLSEVGHNITA